jgi:hypothetical protein
MEDMLPWGATDVAAFCDGVPIYIFIKLCVKKKRVYVYILLMP